MNLPCTNLQDFIYGIKHFYTVDKNGYYEVGDTVTLYNDQHAEEFEIITIYYMENIVLGLEMVS